MRQRYARWIPPVLALGFIGQWGEILVSSPASAEDSKPPVTRNSIGMRLARLPAGAFLMGSAPEEIADLLAQMDKHGPMDPWYRASPPAEGPRHRVRIRDPFSIGVTEVTVGQFRKFVEETGYCTDAEKDGKGGGGRKDGRWREQEPEFSWKNLGYAQRDDEPVVNVTWNDASAFCAWLSKREDKTYRLPTEAEWEYACRAYRTTRYYWGDDLTQMDEYAWHGGNSGSRPHPVGQRRPNSFGLYDMCGNVYEYCLDVYAPDTYTRKERISPRGPKEGKSPVVRGCSWGTLKIHCRSAFRGDAEAYTHRNQRDGFRVVCVQK